MPAAPQVRDDLATEPISISEAQLNEVFDCDSDELVASHIVMTVS